MLREERIQWQSSVDESEVDSTPDGNANEGNAAHRLTKVCTGESPVCRERRADEIRIKHDVLDASEEVTNCANVASDTKNSFVKISGLMDSVAVVKSSKDPLVDFRDSMVDMIIERQIYTAEDLGELLRCFLSLIPSEHHDTIVHAFMEGCAKVVVNSYDEFPSQMSIGQAIIHVKPLLVVNFLSENNNWDLVPTSGDVPYLHGSVNLSEQGDFETKIPLEVHLKNTVIPDSFDMENLHEVQVALSSQNGLEQGSALSDKFDSLSSHNAKEESQSSVENTQKGESDSFGQELSTSSTGL
ncbi:hypothetical protein L7F22_018051 [Adiantum nelumboides]|nr:hypothetical protein [Adiantum nelumboides]